MIRYIKRNKLYFILTLCTSLATGFVPLLLAYAIQLISDFAFNGRFENANTCLWASIFFLVYTMISSSLNSVMKALYRKKLKTSLASDLYESMMSQSYPEFKKEKMGNKLAVFTNDIKMVDEYYFFPILDMIVDVITTIAILFYVMSIHIYVGFMLIGIAVASLLVPKLMEKRLQKYSCQLSTFSGIYNSKLKEIFQNFDVILDLGLLKSFICKGKDLIDHMESKQRDVNMSLSLTANWANTIAATFQLVFMVALGFMILYGHVNMIYMMPIVNVSNNFIGGLSSIAGNLAGFKSVKEVNNKLLDIIDSKKIIQSISTDFDRTIYLNDVCFGYDEQVNVIQDFSFVFEKGKKYAIVGSSGSGKSTILKLILGYYPIQSGNITIPGYQSVSMIHQESYIFDDSLRNNLNMGLSQKDETLLKCLEFVNLQDFDLNQNISEDGSNLSGGQVQRIGIARTLAHLKEVLLCDEITASLDNQTAIEIENRILNLKNQTILYVTHKLFDETLNKFDCILVLDQGKLVEQGTYRELMEKREFFYHLKTNNKKSVRSTNT